MKRHRLIKKFADISFWGRMPLVVNTFSSMTDIRFQREEIRFFMNKAKLFIENFFVYGIGGIISKIIPFVMLPIVTRLMPDPYYFGLSDMSQTIIGFCRYLAILGMYDAMYRMFFEKEEEQYKKEVCSTALLTTLSTSFFLLCIMVLFRQRIAGFFFEDEKYAHLVYLSAISTFVGATNSIVSAPTRMQNKRKVFLITNTVSPLLSYAVSIPLLFAGYYVIALPVAGMISALTLEIVFYALNKEWFSVALFDKKLMTVMLKIGIPLLPEMLVYWVFNSSDRVMITRILGVGEAGIYSVGAKIGMASQLIYIAFAGGWQYFAFSTMHEEDQVKNNTRVFEYLGCISYIATLFICAVSRPLFTMLFTEEYHRSFIVAPYLFLAPLLQMLYQVIANQFLVIKKTWPSMFILLAGALLNVLFNWFYIPIIGIEGAAIASLLGYMVSLLICSIVLIKIRQMTFSPRFLFCTVMEIFMIVLWRLILLDNLLAQALLFLAYTVSVMILYGKDIKVLLKGGG